jgi:carboxyl-terminal processing protease
MSEADLRGSLKNDNGDASEKTEEDEKEDTVDVKAGEEDIVDYQLTRAVDLLQGIYLYKSAVK